MKQSSKSRLHFYALEPRVLLDGAALIDAAQVVEASDCLCFSPEGNLLQSEEIADPTILPAIAPSEPQRNEVVFIDANLPDYQLLVDGVDPNAEVFLVEAGVDGWAYMSEVLSERTDIDAIHVLGHGAEGVAVLGTAVLDSEHLEEYREVLSTIGQALTSEGDILLWGCRVGAEGEGESFINQIASLTGADIAASDDLTGISGDWDLEVNSGDIEEYNLLDIEELESFEHDLGITSTSGPNISYGGGTLYVNFTLDLATAPGFMNSHNNGDSMHLSIGGYTGPQTSSTLYFGGGGSIVDATNRNGNVHVGSTWSFNSIGITMDGTYTIHFQVRSTTQGAIEYLPSGSIALSFNAAPTLSNLTTSETYLENTVNASAQLIDSDVSFADSDGGNLSGGQLTVTGVNATETISISNQDVGTSGNIQLSGSNVQVSNGSSWTTFATLSGGSGSNLTISFNGSSTPTYIDSLIQRLTYQSSSATGENAHNLSLTVTDGDGGSSGGKTISVTVTGENDAPSFSGNGTLSAVDEDTSSPSGATVTSIMNSLFSDDDSDSFAGIAISTDGSNNATEGDWEYSTDGSSWYDISSVTTSGALLLNTSTKLRFVPVAEYNGTPGSLTVFAVDDSSATTFTSGATRQTFDTTADDATSKVAAAGVTIGTSITAANDAPVATAGATLAYSENSSAAAIDATVTLSDVDDTQITGATVTLSSGFTSGDTLGFSTQNGISGSYNSSTGVLTLSGTATVAQYQAALRTVTYSSSSEDPTSGSASRTVSWQVTDANSDGDGAQNSSAVTSTINLTASNDTPVATAGATLAYSENGSAAAIDNTIALSDSDDTQITAATVTLSSGFTNGDTLGFTTQNGISGSYNSSAGVLTLSGSATVAQYQTALRTVTYSSSSEDPTSGSASRTVSWQVTDANSDGAGAQNSSAVTSTINLTASNDTPTATAGGTLAYSEHDSATAIDSTLTLSDSDDTQFTAATVTISSGLTSGDTLGFTTQNGISGSYNSGTGVLTLSGTATVAQYQSALRSVTYINSTDDLTSTSASRTISWQVTDANSDGAGAQNSSSVTSTINITATNDTPVATAGATLAYSENGSAAAIDTSITLSDVDDSQIAGATVTLSSGFTSGDTLGFSTQNGISGSYNSSTGVLTLSGSATVAQYQSALRTVTYSSSSEDPTTNGSSSSRTVSWQVTDANSDGAGAENSSSVTSTINITASNDAPTSSNGTVSVTELVSYSLQASDFNFSDVDSGDTLAKIKIVTLPANGSLTLSGNAVTAGDEILIADINAGNLKYTHSDHTTIGNSYTSFTYKVNDSQIDSVSAYTLTINVSADTFISDGTQYLSQSKTVYSLDTSSQPYTFNTIVTADNRLNSIGFNYDDGYIYGTINGTNKIYRIGASGTIVDLGAVSGLPSKTYFRGDFDQQGNYYIIDARKLYIVDVDTMSVTSTQRLSARFGAADGAYNEHDGKLYGASRNKLYSLDPSNGKVEVKWVDNLPSNTWGAAWFDGAGRFFVAGNQTGDIFRIDDFSNPEAVFVSKGQPSGNNDGTASDAAPVFIHTVSTPAANAYLGGTSVTHTYAIDNGKQPSVLSSGFEDTLSDSRTFDTSTLQIVDSDGNTLAGGGVNYTATFSLSDSKLVISGLSVPALKQFTITVDVDLPVMTPEIYYNQAKLTGIESNLSSNGEILSDNPGGIKPDATPMVVASATATNKITGTVFNDLDQDGVKDSNETGIGGVKLTLSNGDISYTDVNGSYTFDFLADGTYSITETQPSGFTSYTADTITGVIVAGGSTQTVDFADFGEGSITGTVYLDQNGNTTQDGTEGGLNSVTVTLKNSSGTTVSTTTTDSEGRYDFSNVTPGAYWVEQTLPSGYTNTSAQNVSINLGASKKVEVNFGDIGTGIITGTVFDDLNGNATQEVAEDGLSGVTLTLTDSSGSSSTTTTDSDGFYQFTALTSGTYSVTETDPSSYSSDTSNTQTAVIVNGGSAGVHFADRKTGSLSGFTFADLNGDGTFDADDVGISGITITLTDRDGDTFSATTANNGSYQFLNVDPGSYTVDSGGKSGYISIAGTQRSGTLASDGSSVSNFAMVPPGLILGTVYNDYDGDGEQGASENGLSGVEITLTDSSNNATYIHTDSDGSFEFSSVAAGTYTVSESDPTGFVSTTNSYSVTLAGGDSANVNFGDRPSGSLSGTVFDDRDGDATQDVGENGLSNVTLTLSNGDTATTDNDGFYLFDNIAIGDYTLVETDPANVISTTNNSVAVTISSNAAASVDYADQIKFAPISVNDAYTLNEGATLTTNASTGVVANDTDKNSDTLTTTLISGVSNGTLTLNSDGSFSYIHDGSETTSDSFSYKINDGTQDSGNATVNLTITPVNDAPVLATNTGMTINEDSAATTLTTSMLNVTDVDNSDAQLTYTVTTSPTKGSLSHSSFTQAQLAAGLINYTPSADQYGADSFTFTVSDGAGGSISATQYAITITNINDAPVVANAIPDQSHSGSGSWSYQVPSNTFSDVDLEDTHSWSAILGDGSALPSWLSFNTTTRTFTGNPPNGVTSVSLKVSVDDGNGGTEDDTFVLTISSANDDPVASDDSGSATEAGGVTNGTTGSSASGNVLTNDSDNDTGDTKAVAAIRSGSTEGSGTAGTLGNALAGNYGSLTINSDGSYSYSIDENNASVEALANGETITDTFNYTVADSQSATDIALLTVTITGSNDAPVITNGPDTASLTETDSALTTSGTLTVGDVDTTDVITSTISGLVVSGTSNRSDSAAPSDAELLAMLTITPTATLNGTETSKTLNWSFDSGSELFDYLATGETLILTYSVTATDDDGTALSDSETLTLTVTGSNDDPVITGGAYSNGITESNSALSDSGSFTISDVDTSDVISATRTLVVSGTSDRTDSAALADSTLLSMLTVTATPVSGSSNNGTLNWSFDSGAETFDYLATGETLILTYSVTTADDDGTALSDSETVTLTLTGSNDGPTITNGPDLSGLSESDSGLSDSGTLTVGDLDVNNLVVSTFTQSVGGTGDRTLGSAPEDSDLLTMFTITPTATVGNADQSGTLNWSFDSGTEPFNYLKVGETLVLTYTVTATENDAAASSATATVTVTITGTNDLPLITAVSDQAMTEDTSSSLTLAVDDLENESLTYAISGGSNETVTATMVGRQITLTPASNYESMTPIPFTVTVTDASGGSSNITFNVTVANANDAPYSTSTIPKQSAAQGTPYSYTLPNGLFGDIDTGDAAALTHQITLASGDPLPSWLSFDAASGVLSGTPGNDDVTTDALILRVTATDPSAATGELDFVMELININDAPVAIDDIYSVDEANQLNISAGNGLLSNDQDPDAGDSQVVSSVNGQSISVGQTVTLSGGGTLTINQDGSLSLDASSAYNHLADGENATETATYTLADSEGLSDSGTVTFTVVGKNDAPVLEANKTVIVDQYSARKESDANRTGLGIVAPTDLDSDSSTLGVTITHLPTGGTTYNGTTIVTANDTLTTDELLALRFKPTQGFNGDAGQLIYEVSDGSSSATQAISIQIQAVQYLDIVSLDSVHAEGGSSGDSSGTTDYTFTVHRSGYLNGATDVNWQVDFSEAAGDATNSDFLNSTLANGTVTFAADEVSKQVTVSVLADGVVESDEDFTVRLTSSAIDADTIAAGVIQRSLQATADGVIQNDDTAPQISSVSGPVVTGESRLYWSGDELIVEMQFDRIVVTSGTLTLDLTIGTLAGGGSSITDQTRQATLKEGSGTNTLRFAYTIQSEDVDPDGIAVVANSLSGSISDLSGNSADLTLTASDLPNLNNLRINAFDGVVVDGYITGGTVFADADRDQTLDAGEASDTTDNSGNFTILGGEGPLVLSGGTDISTNLAFEGVFEAPPRAEVINPLTTLLVEMAGYSASDASFQSTQAPLRTALGLDASIDLYTYDPIIEASRPNATAGEITIAVTAQKEAAKIANLLVQGSSVLAGAVTSGTLNSGDAGRAIASALASYINARPSQAIDLSDTTVIQTVLNSAAGNLSGIDTARVSSVASLAASVIGASNDKVAAASADAAGLTAIAQSQVVAQGDAADALESGTNSNDLSSAQSSYTGANLDSAVNSASVGTIFPVYLEISESVASQFEGDSAGGTGTNGYGFTVTRSGDTNTAFSVDYTISGEVNSSDFASGSLTGTLSFVSGETSKSLTLDVLADLDRESDESFSVTLSNASVLANLTTEQASGEILNDDPRTPTVTLPTTPSIRVGVPTTISGISVDDGDSNTLSLTLVSTNGTLSLAGPATISGSNTSLTVSGTLDQLNTTLGNLIFEGTTGEVSATITITPDDSDATTFETASTLNINLESAPEHLLPSRPSVVGGHATEILGIAIRDIDDAHRGENITLTLTPDKGTIGLTASGSLTINDLAAGKKQLIGTVGDINATLGSLDFTATRGETSASIQFESTDGSVLTPDDSDLLLMDIVAAPEQTVATADLTVIAGNATSVPGFTVSDLDSANLQATLTPYGGTIAVDSLGSVVISEPSSGVIRLYGLVAEVNSVLNTLTFTGGATDLSARINMVTTDLSVITPAATGNYDFNIIHTPDLALPATPSLVAGSTLEVSGISLTDADTDTHTITLTATGGSIAADAAAGATVTTVSGSVLTISGSTATVNNTLTNLEFTAPSATVASTGTIQMVANDNDSRTGNDSETLSLNILADPDLSLAATQHLVSGVATAVSGISVVGGGSGVVTAQLVVSGGSISLTGNSLGAVAHSGEDRYTITGTADGVNQVLATLTFNGDSGVGSNASIQFSVDLGNILLGNLSGTQAIEVHDAPTLTVPGTTPLATVGVPLGVDGITVNDIDDNSLTMTLTPASGSLSLTAAGAVAATTDSGSGVVTLIGTPADINSSLDTLRYTAVAGSATGTIAVSVDDSDSITSNATSSWSLDLVARPELTLPASAAVAEGVPVSLSGISVADSDSSALTLTLTPTNGILNSVAGDLILTGTASAINASLNALTFTADIGATSATLSGELTDGDSRTANATGAIPLTVVVGQPPLAGGDLTVTAIAEDSTATAVNLSLTPTTLDDPDDDAGGVDQTPQQLRIISVTGGTLTQSDSSVITLGANGTKLTLTGGTIGLRFTPDSDRDTDATVTYVLVDRIIDSLNSTASTVTVPITAAQDAPVITHSATTFTYTDTAADDTFVTQTLAATATDADTGATLSWGIQNPTDSSVVTTLDGTFGTLSVTGSTFSYTPNDTALEGIKSNNTEHFNIQVSDGIDVSTQLLTIEVTAENDPTQFGGDDSGAVTEDQVASASGTLTVSDRDSADGTVVAQSGIAGSYGTFSIDSSGNWSYQLDDSKPTVQSLAGATVPLTTTAATAQLAPQTLGGSGSERVSEAFTVTTSAGENHTINVTIRGDNDIPTASGTLTDDQKLQGEGLSKETAHLFSDIDNNTVFYYYANNLPRGLTIDSSTGVISGAATRAGLYDVVIHAYDGDGGTATADWNILVVAPVMTESPPPEPGGSTGTEGNPGGGENPSIPGLGPKRPGSGGFDPTGETIPGHQNPIPVPSGTGGIPSGPGGPGDIPGGAGELPGGTRGIPSGTGELPVGPGGIPGGTGELPVGPGGIPSGAGELPGRPETPVRGNPPAPGGEGGIPNGIPKGDVPNGLPPVEGLNDGDIDTNELPQDTPSDEEPSEVIATGSEVAEDQTRRDSEIVSDHVKVGSDAREAREIELKRVDRVDVSVNSDGQVKLVQLERKEGEVSAGLMLVEVRKVDFHYEIEIVDFNQERVLQYSATNPDGEPLPIWVRVDAESGFIYANPPAGVEQLDLRLVAQDRDGASRMMEIKLDFSGKDVNQVAAIEMEHRPSFEQQLQQAGAEWSGQMDDALISMLKDAA